MGLYFDFPAGWWLIILFIWGLYFFLFLQRKSYQKSKELKTQVISGIVGTLLGFIVLEGIGINTKLWIYFPGNLPIILLPFYFGTGLLGYQLIKKIEEVV